jgi:hypothetical protein
MMFSNKPAYNKPEMKPMRPMKPTGGPMPMFPGNKPAYNKPMGKPSKNQQSLDAIKRRLDGM